MATHASKESARTVGLLLVHGVGRQKPSELLEAFERDVVPVKTSKTKRRAHSTFQHADRLVHLYEVHWADILTGRRVLGSFRSVDPPTLTWFPLLNLVTRSYRNPRFPFWEVLCWTAFLIPAGLILAVMYYGAGLLVDIFKERDGFLWLHGVLDDYAGDVANYTNSMGGARPGSHLASCSEQIRSRFERTMSGALEDGCDEIYVLAHSLGTVVMYHGLTRKSGEGTLKEALSRVRAVFTIGSPLEKVAFFWPRLVGAPGPSRRGHAPIEWINFYSWFDVVSGRLRRFKRAVSGWANVKPRRLRGLGGIARAHMSYLKHPVLQEGVTRWLFGEPHSTRMKWSQRVRHMVGTIGEVLAVPLLMALAFVAGLPVLAFPVALVVLLALSVYVLLTRGDWSLLTAVDNLWWAAVAVAWILVKSLRTAVKEHRQYWRATETKDAPA